jgi:hypothetical protein
LPLVFALLLEGFLIANVLRKTGRASTTFRLKWRDVEAFSGGPFDD